MSNSYHTNFLHLDSSNSTYITDINNTTGVFTNPYKTQFKMPQTFRSIKRVYLKSLELPVGFSNIRKGSTDTLKFFINGAPYTVVLPEKNYTQIAQLLIDINTAIIAVIPPTIVMAIGLTGSLTNPNRCIINFTGSVSNFSILDTNLSKFILGFRGLTDTLVASVYSASSSNYDLSPDNYILMHIPTLNAFNASMCGQQSTFKIPLNSINSQVYYYMESQSFTQWVDITDKNLTISSLNVVLYDKFGCNLHPNGIDWSFTLAMEIFN